MKNLSWQLPILVLGSIVVLGLQNISIAQPTQPTKNIKSVPTPIQYRYPKTAEIVSTTKARGTRWKARRDLFDVITLTPNKQGVIASENPILWFYLEGVAQLDLEMDGKQVYQYQADPNSTISSGIVGIPLSRIVLDPNRRYQWKLSFRYGVKTSEGKQTLSDIQDLQGEVYRLDRVAENALNRDLIGVTDAREKITIYLKHGVWYELLSDLFELRQQQPEEFAWAKIWRDLLESPDVRFMDIRKDPIVPDLDAIEKLVKAKVVGNLSRLEAAGK
jgi:Domain of Unknown Function (DUF928)